MKIVQTQFVTVALLIASLASATAQGVLQSSVTTNAIVESCRRASDHLQMDCAGYILGVFDQLSLSGLICPPINPSGGSAQAVAVALKFLTEHPERWHFTPGFLMREAFETAFPCPKNSN